MHHDSLKGALMHERMQVRQVLVDVAYNHVTLKHLIDCCGMVQQF